MGNDRREANFDRPTRLALAQRAAYECSICRAQTTGPSGESMVAVANVGVAAHICAASPGGPRFDATQTWQERCGIENAIWLCQTHAKLIDDDVFTWTVEKLKKAKVDQESRARRAIGVAKERWEDPKMSSLVARECAFLRSCEMNQAYQEVIGIILHVNKLSTNDEIGMLLCGSSFDDDDYDKDQPPWTVFVDAKWLHWYWDGQNAGFPHVTEIPDSVIYGMMPAWPDSFLEFLQAMVNTDTTFSWKRGPKGYFILTPDRTK